MCLLLDWNGSSCLLLRREADAPASPTAEDAEIAVDGARFGAVLALVKGQKLLARTLPMLPLAERAAALVEIVRGLLGAPPLASAKELAAAAAADGDTGGAAAELREQVVDTL